MERIDNHMVIDLEISLANESAFYQYTERVRKTIEKSLSIDETKL